MKVNTTVLLVVFGIVTLLTAGAAVYWALTGPSASGGDGMGLVRAESPAPPAPLTFTDAKGAELTLADFAGTPVLVNLWATWCAPCVTELPSLDRLAAARDGTLEVIALSLDRDGAEALPAFFATNGIAALKPYYDPKMLSLRAWAAPGLPTTLIIDAQGNEVARVVGPMEWDDAQTAAMLEDVLAP